jgi:hypothetical protein
MPSDRGSKAATPASTAILVEGVEENIVTQKTFNSILKFQMCPDQRDL